jgi:octaprenyl-diphosphate synthase
MTDLKQTLMEAIADDLVRIEAALAANLVPHFDLVRETAGHLLFSGGKRLRPLLLLLSARLCGRDDETVVRLSVIMEYLHAATLLHDDVVDGGTLRRGRTVVNRVWDPPTAVLTGDFLLARTLSLAASSGDLAVIAAIATFTELMSQGEIQQLADKGDIGITEEHYMEIIRCKTAVLIEGSCRVGAMLAGVTNDMVAALASYGNHLGLAFQMADDLLDYTADSQGLGKVVGADLREGKMTLPVIHAMAVASGPDRDRMAAALRADEVSPEEFEAFAKLLEDNGGLAYTRKKARRHVARAKAQLDRFEESATRKVLADIADYALSRKK